MKSENNDDDEDPGGYSCNNCDNLEEDENQVDAGLYIHCSTGEL